MSEEWINLHPVSTFPVGVSRCFLVRGQRIAVFRCEPDVWHAVDDVCPHAGAPLSDGWIENGCVICPWHGAGFSLESGAAMSPPASEAVKIYSVRVQDEQLQLFWS